MRKFGIQLRWRRSDWSRQLPRYRFLESCAQLAELYGMEICRGLGPEVPLQLQTLGGVGVPALPEEETLLPVVLPAPPGGIGCPQVLTQQGWIQQDNLAIQQMQAAGIQIPVVGSGPVLVAIDSTILQIRQLQPGNVDTRSCFFPGTPGETQAVVAALNAAGGL